MTQQLGRQRGRQGQRVDGRDDRRDGDGYRELFVELAGDTTHEGHRNEDGTQDQPDGQNRPRNFTHGLVGSLQRAEAQLDIAFNVFHHDDGIVHHDTDGQDQAEQGQGVDRVPQQIQKGEGPDDGHRDGNQRNDRGAPGLQEQHHDQDDEHHRFEQGVLHGVDGLTHKDGRVPDADVTHALREVLGQTVQLGVDRVCNLDGIGAGGEEKADGDFRVFAPEYPQRVVVGVQLHAGHI